MVREKSLFKVREKSESFILSDSQEQVDILNKSQGTNLTWLI